MTDASKPRTQALLIASHRMNWKNTSTTLRSVTLLARKVAPASREQIARHLFFRHLIVCVAAFTQLLNWQLTAHAATFTNDATITETNTAFDDQDIIVSGATVTIDGPHSFSSLLLTNGAVLTHSSCTTTATHRLDLAISNAIAVSGNSRIDVSYRGYVLGQTSGNTTNGAATGHAGGSYGGLGAAYNGTPNAVYGDYADPDDWGSGGAGIADNGYGGGLARIVVGALALDGQLLADGINNGSGGGIYVAVNTLRGAGLIRAMGGLGPYAGGAGGGGGRVAVYAADMAGFDLSRITAPGGHTANSDGGAGTVYVAQGLPHAHVRSFQPKGLNGGLVGNELPTITNRTGYFSNVFDRFTLTFNKPINTNSYDASKLLINGPNGPITAGGFIEISNRTYQIPLDQQTANGVYQFTLLPSLLDTEGFQLDQNANGIPGETNDAYSFTLIMDRVGPRVTQHSPSGGVPLGIASMEIEFNEAIDPTTFSTTDVLIITPTGQTNAITAVQTLNSNRFRITFPPLAAPGLHRLRVGPNIQDLAGNALDQDRDGIAGESLDDVYDVCFYVHEAAGSGLVSWWRAEGNTLDSIGTNHGVLNSGVAFAPGRIGQAFNFDGQNGSVNIPDGPSVRLGSEFTVDFWFSPARFITTADTMAHTFLSKGSDDSIGTANRDGRIEVRGPSPRIQSAASTWQANVWHHVALTYVAGVYRLFVDGAEQASTTNLHAILDNPNPIQLGVSP